MDSILKKLLMQKVKKEISNVTYDELDQVYGIYENLINLNNEFCDLNDIVDPTKFIKVPIILHREKEDNSFEIFLSLITLLRQKTLNFVDYTLIINSKNEYLHNINLDCILHHLRFLKWELGNRASILKDFAFRIDVCFIEPHREKEFLASKYISNDYKKIIMLLTNILRDYQTNYIENINDFGWITFDNYLGSILYYFLLHNIINDKPDEAYNFLLYIKDHLIEEIDNLLIARLDSIDDAYHYVEYTFNNYKKKIKHKVIE